MVEKLKIIIQFVGFLVAVDLMILFFALLQIMTENTSGYWSPFWTFQADLLLRFL